MTDLSTRAQKALDLLKQGALFRERLERDNYTGRSQFKIALVLNGKKVRGYSSKTFYEVRNMLHMTNGGTSVSTYWKLSDDFLS